MLSYKMKNLILAAICASSMHDVKANHSPKEIKEIRNQVEDYGDLLRTIDKSVVQIVVVDSKGDEAAGCGIVWNILEDKKKVDTEKKIDVKKANKGKEKVKEEGDNKDQLTHDSTYIILTKAELLNNASTVIVRHLDKEYQGVIMPIKRSNNQITLAKNNHFSVALVMVKAPANALNIVQRSKKEKMGLGRRIVLRGAYADTNVPITSFGYIVGETMYTASHKMNDVTKHKTMHALQITAHTTSGCAGAGVFNTDGELVGIVQNVIGFSGKEGEGNMMVSDSAVVMPVDMLERIINAFFEKRQGYSYLGMNVQSLEGLRDVLSIPQFKHKEEKGNDKSANKVDKEIIDQVNSSGVLISDIVKDSPAFKANINVGDILLRIEDKYIKDTAQAQSILSKIESGTSVKLLILTKESKYKVMKIINVQTVSTLTNQDTNDNAVSATGNNKDKKPLSISKISYMGEDKTPVIGYILHELPNATYMETERALQVGDLILSVDNIQPKNTQELQAKLNTPGKYLLYVLRGGKNKFFTVTYIG